MFRSITIVILFHEDYGYTPLEIPQPVSINAPRSVNSRIWKNSLSLQVQNISKIYLKFVMI